MTRAYRRRSEVSRRNIPPELRDMRQWKPIDTSQMTAEERERLQSLQVATCEYVEGKPVKPWLKLAGESHAEFLRKLNRSVLRTAHGGIVGWAAFVPHAIRMPYRRRKDTSGQRPQGLSGALYMCFDRVERLQATLTAEILKQRTYQPHEARVAKKDLHSQFIDLCTKAGLGKEDWPFNTRNEGRRAIARFFDRVLVDFYEQGVRSRAGEAAASKLRTGTGHARLLRPEHPYDIVEMDAHSLHLIGSVGLPKPDGLIEYIPIERLQLLLLCDVRSSLILGYAVVIRRDCKSDDILDAVYSCLAPWRPRSLCLSVHQYDEGAGLPSGILDEAAGCGFAILCVDNALINWAGVIFDRIVPRVGCAVNWGPVHSWMRRPLVERIFGELERLGFLRMPSTTGSHPKDPRREKAEQKARALRIHFEVILDILDLEIARFNRSRSEGKFGTPRMDILRQYLQRPELGFNAPKLPVADGLHPDLDVTIDVGFVRAKNEHPYTKYGRIRYRGTELAGRYDLIDKRIVRHVRRSNVRTIELYDLGTGIHIDTATAEWPWSDYDVSLGSL